MNLQVVLDAYKKAMLKGDAENAKLNKDILAVYYHSMEQSDKNRFNKILECSIAINFIRRATAPMLDRDKVWYGRYLVNIPPEKAKGMTNGDMERALVRTMTQL